MITKTFILSLVVVLILIISSLSLFHQNSLPNNIIDKDTYDEDKYDTKNSDLNLLDERNAKLSRETFSMLKTGKRHSHKKTYKKRKEKFQVSFEGISSFPQHKTECKAEEINVIVNYNNCISREITNKYCSGTCYSIFIPKLRQQKLKESFQMVSSCVPVEYEVIKIRLECPNQEPNHVYRQFVKVNSCSCKQFFP
uniref:Bursicon n=1 Tax=Strongyloides stercoralis TaxID=6248 RepID=A0A0K0EFE2_STRER